MEKKKETEVVNAKIKIVGVGGGGSNAVENMYNEGIKGVTYMICNTDKTALDASKVPNKVAIGTLGAGNDPEVARKAAEDHAKDIEAALKDEQTQMVFITAGMGGGTGTGASPVIASIARKLNILTVGIVTIPFRFEGMKKIKKALRGIKQMEPNVDAIIVINNEKMTLTPNLPFPIAFKYADSVLLNAAKSIADIVNVRGYMNIDFADVSATLRGGKMAVINTGEGEGAHRVAKSIENALKSSLLNNRDIFKSNRLLLNFYCSTEYAITAQETAQIEAFTSKMHDDMDVIWGLTYDENLGEKCRVTLLASGQGVICPEEYIQQYKELDNDRKHQRLNDGTLARLDEEDDMLERMTENPAVKR
ncbi:MAG: cell division protein FtsZ [Paludibacteraceae bacterium]|nr:cell division protein FtsZ [Paludibacteraceae bacterium]